MRENREIHRSISGASKACGHLTIVVCSTVNLTMIYFEFPCSCLSASTPPEIIFILLLRLWFSPFLLFRLGASGCCLETLTLFCFSLCFKDWGQEEKGTTEDEMVGWHYRLSGREFEQAPGDDERQRGPACCSPSGRRIRHDWVTQEQQQRLVYTLATCHLLSFWLQSYPYLLDSFHRLLGGTHLGTSYEKGGPIIFHPHSHQGKSGALE